MWKNVTMEDCEKCPFRDNFEICGMNGCPVQQERYRQRARFLGNLVGKLLFQTPFLFILMSL